MTEQKQAKNQFELAEEISKQLIHHKLINANHQSKLAKQINAGTIRADDWRLLVETADKPEKPNA